MEKEEGEEKDGGGFSDGRQIDPRAGWRGKVVCRSGGRKEEDLCSKRPLIFGQNSEIRSREVRVKESYDGALEASERGLKLGLSCGGLRKAMAVGGITGAELPEGAK